MPRLAICKMGWPHTVGPIVPQAPHKPHPSTKGLVDPPQQPKSGKTGAQRGQGCLPVDTQSHRSSARPGTWPAICPLGPKSRVPHRDTEPWGSEPPEHSPTKSALTWARCPGLSEAPHLSWLLHGSWRQGGCSPCTTRASNRNLGAQKPRAPVTKAMAVTPRVDHTKLQLQEKVPWLRPPGEGWGHRAWLHPSHTPTPGAGGGGAPGSGSSLTFPKSPAHPPPHFPSRWAFLLPLCRTRSPHPRRPNTNSTFSRKLSPLPPPSSKCPPLVAWLCIKESWVLSSPHIPVNREAWECS